MKTRAIGRKELYDRVWAEPMMRLATSFGMSDVGLAKICRKHNIPRPPRGYWARKQVGQNPPQASLPDPEKNYSIEIREAEDTEPPPSLLPDEMINQLDAEAEKTDLAEKADDLRNTHSLVRQANAQLLTAETDAHGLLVMPENAILDLQVSRKSLRRALLMMDVVLRTCELRGYAVKQGPLVVILDVEIGINILEKTEIQNEDAGELDVERQYYSFGFNQTRKKRVPNGRLTLNIGDNLSYWDRDNGKKSWSDSDTRRMEDGFPKVMFRFLQLVASARESRIARAIEEKKSKKKERREQLIAKRREILRGRYFAEKAKVRQLVQEARKWRRSIEIRHFIEAKKNRHIAQFESIEPGSPIDRWIQWATLHADRLDPLRQSPASILDQAAEFEKPARDDRREWWRQ